MWPRSWRNQHSKFLLGTALGLCLTLPLHAQTAPLEVPKETSYPGIFQTLEKLIQIDTEKLNTRTAELLRTNRLFTDARSISGLELDSTFLNSVVLHSKPGYLRLASVDKCRFYDALLTDLLKDSQGKVANVVVTYLSAKNEREYALLSKKDFLNKVVRQECPETQKMIDQYQLKNISQTLQGIAFEAPTGMDQCRSVLLSWVQNPNTPYLCQIQEFLSEAKTDPTIPAERRSMARVLEQKLSVAQKDYLENLCANLDNEAIFCEDFLNVSFWNKIGAGLEDKIYADALCRRALGTPTINDSQLKLCLSRMKKESDLCLYQAGPQKYLSPQMECEALALALNYSSLRSTYEDCPGNSDQFTITNMGRILLNISKAPVKPFEGPCTSVSQGEFFTFNTQFDNTENWKLEACYDDKLNEREVCARTYFGNYSGSPEAYPNVVAGILRNTRGADSSLKCRMVESTAYNPLLLEYKSGCYIVYDQSRCFMSECPHKILYNDRPIDFIRTRNRLAYDYFPNTVQGERYSQNYLLTRDYRQNGRSLSTLAAIETFFKKSKKGIIHGIGCAENLLPTFFRMAGMNQCTPMPFITDGIIKDNDSVVLVTRTAADSLQAPRLISWSNVFSAVKTYQRHHPLKYWTMYGLD